MSPAVRANPPERIEPSVRPLQLTDAHQLNALEYTLAQESPYVLLDPVEDRFTVWTVMQRILNLKSNDALLGAFHGDALLGYAQALGGPTSRTSATARVTIGVLPAAQGQGVGRRLLTRLDDWARVHGIHRLELMVIVGNVSAIHLYESCGYATEHVRRHTMRVNGRFVDQLSMAKLLD